MTTDPSTAPAQAQTAAVPALPGLDLTALARLAKAALPYERDEVDISGPKEAVAFLFWFSPTRVLNLLAALQSANERADQWEQHYKDATAWMNQVFICLMAALIAAVRTARFEDREFQGMGSPRVMAQIANSLWLARKIVDRSKD
jgi:hypothetical protein